MAGNAGIGDAAAAKAPPAVPPEATPRRAGPLLPVALAVAILAISTGSVFVRFAQREAPSLLIAAARLGLATLALAPFALSRHRAELAALTRRQLGLGLAAGIFLALHFATWIASLEHTSVVSSVVLVTTSTLWVALLSPWLLRERLTSRIALGIALALAGSIVVGAADAGRGAPASPGPSHGWGMLYGDFLALCGAWAMAGYLMIGRHLRVRLALVPYVFLVYGMGAVVLAAAVLVSGTGVATLQPATWGWLVLLAVVPQLIGHSTFNWALRDLPAALVSVALLGEPVGSALLAYLFLGERPGAGTLVGAAIVLAGLAIAASSPRRRGVPAA